MDPSSCPNNSSLTSLRHLHGRWVIFYSFFKLIVFIKQYVCLLLQEGEKIISLIIGLKSTNKDLLFVFLLLPIFLTGIFKKKLQLFNLIKSLCMIMEIYIHSVLKEQFYKQYCLLFKILYNKCFSCPLIGSNNLTHWNTIFIH